MQVARWQVAACNPNMARHTDLSRCTIWAKVGRSAGSFAQQACIRSHRSRYEGKSPAGRSCGAGMTSPLPLPCVSTCDCTWVMIWKACRAMGSRREGQLSECSAKGAERWAEGQLSECSTTGAQLLQNLEKKSHTHVHAFIGQSPRAQLPQHL